MNMSMNEIEEKINKIDKEIEKLENEKKELLSKMVYKEFDVLIKYEFKLHKSVVGDWLVMIERSPCGPLKSECVTVPLDIFLRAAKHFSEIDG